MEWSRITIGSNKSISCSIRSISPWCSCISICCTRKNINYSWSNKWNHRNSGIYIEWICRCISSCNCIIYDFYTNKFTIMCLIWDSKICISITTSCNSKWCTGRIISRRTHSIIYPLGTCDVCSCSYVNLKSIWLNRSYCYIISKSIRSSIYLIQEHRWKNHLKHCNNQERWCYLLYSR